MKSAQEITRQAEAAQQEYLSQEAKLYRHDGQKRYSEAEHTEQVKELRQERNRKLNALGEEANAAMHEATAKAAAIKNEDLSGRLTSEELANANARRGFIVTEVSEMNYSSLTARMDSVLAAGDRASAFCHARAIRSRAASSERPVPGLDEQAKRAEDYLFGESRNSEIQAAEGSEREYMSAAMLAGNLKQGARTAAGAFEARLGARRAG